MTRFELGRLTYKLGRALCKGGIHRWSEPQECWIPATHETAFKYRCVRVHCNAWRVSEVAE